jgi:hypothetical protein
MGWGDVRYYFAMAILVAMIIFVLFNFLAFLPFPWQRQPF